METVANTIPSDAKIFRSAVIPMFIWLFVFVMILLLCVILALDGHIIWRVFLKTILIVVLPLLIITTWVFYFAFPVGISSSGIYGHSIWGFRRFIGWQDIARVKKIRVLNLEWLRIYSAVNGKVTWLAHFQKEPTKFIEEIHKQAPPNNTVLTFLKTK